MAFQLKDFASIVASMINRARATQSRVTDFEVGSVARTLMEAPAIEIEQFYQRMFAGIMDAIPVSIYRGFNFSVADPVKATGKVTITFAEPLETAITIPTGTVFVNRTTTQRYLSTAEVVAPIGAVKALITIEAERIGSIYNVGPGQITSATNLRLPIGSSMTNDAILTGNDGESDEERAARFVAYIQSISRGTAFSVRYAAGTAKVFNDDGEIVEYVSRVDLVETPGFVQVFIYGANATPSADLIAAVMLLMDGYYDRSTGAYVPGYRPIGVDVAAIPMTEQAVNLSVSVGLAPGYELADIQDAVRDSVAVTISSVLAGQTLYVDVLRNGILAVPGVTSVFVDLAVNMECEANKVFVPGIIAVFDILDDSAPFEVDGGGSDWTGISIMDIDGGGA